MPWHQAVPTRKVRTGEGMAHHIQTPSRQHFQFKSGDFQRNYGLKAN